MRLLIITQVIDTEHPVLGFFHRWVLEFAKHCEQVHVVALQVGTHHLPDNVTVHSLGKESGASRLKYLWRFYRYIWQLRHDYDNVFVHMNQIYIILGAPLWRLWGKRIGLWYAHGAVTVSLRLSVWLSHVVFTSTEQGMRVETTKRAVVGQGIDPEQFTPQQHDRGQTHTLITVGRIAASKNIDTLLRAVALVKEQGVALEFSIVGSATTPDEQRYEQDMKALATKLQLDAIVTWVGPKPHEQLPELFAAADLFIHDGSTNSLDKTLVEASFAGCTVISSNPSYRGLTEAIAPELLFPPKDHQALASIIREQIDQTATAPARVRAALLTSCSLPGLISGIVTRY